MPKAVIDIGTNSCRLFIADIDRAKRIIPILKKVELTMLGEGVNKTKQLKKESIDRTLEVLKKYEKFCKENNVTEIKAFATSAVRDSTNKEDFLKEVLDNTNIEIKCIDGETEGLAAFVGATSEISQSERILLVDIGGGSTEFSYGQTNDNPESIKSLNIGVVRFKEMLEDGEIKNYDELGKYIKNKLNEIKNIKEDFILMGVAASITGQIALYNNELYDSEKSHNAKLTLEMVTENYNMLKNMNLEDIAKLPSVQSRRVDVALPGTFLLKTILEFFNKDYIITSEKDLLEGHFLLNFIK